MDADTARQLAGNLRKMKDAEQKLINADLDAITDTEVEGLAQEYADGIESLNDNIDSIAGARMAGGIPAVEAGEAFRDA